MQSRLQNCTRRRDRGGIAMMPRLKMGLLAAGFIGLGTAAVTGWVRNPTPANPYAYAAPATGTTATAPANYDQYGQPSPAYAQPAGYQSAARMECDDAAAPPAYASHRYVRTVRARQEGYADRYVEAPAHRGRSTGKS